MDIESLIYVSEGNIPSKAAHSLQIMCMAYAFSKKVKSFELVLNKSIWPVAGKESFNLFSYYNVSEFDLKYITLSANKNIYFPQYYRNPLFLKLASAYAWLKKPDVVFTRNLHAACYCLRMNLPVVLEFHAEVPRNVFSREVFKKPGFLGCVTIAEDLKWYYVKEGLEPEKIIVEHDGVNISRFSLSDTSKKSLRELLNLPLEKNIFTYCGHLYEFKGMPLILDAASDFTDDIFLLVGGWDHDIQRLKQECKKRNLSNVIFAGYVEPGRVPSFLAASDFLLLPNSGKHAWSETTSPLKLFEYMASERPVIATNLPNIASVLKDGSNALLFEADSGTSFREKITYLRQNRDVAKKIAAKALDDVGYYDWEKRAERIIDFITARKEHMNRMQNGNLTSLSKRFKIRVCHGGRKRGIGGPAVKLSRMNRFFPNYQYFYNIIYSVSSSVPADVCARARTRGIKIVQHINSLYHPAYRSNFDEMNKPYKAIYQLADYIVFGSEFAKAGAKKYFGELPAPHEIIYNSVDVRHFTPSLRPPDRFNILAIGSHYIRHRIEPLIMAMPEIVRQFPNARLIIAGSLKAGEGIFNCSKESFVKLARDAGVDNIEFIAQYTQQDAPEIYGLGDVLVHLKHMDWTPNTIIEAMACGLPVLHVGNGGMHELVGDAGISLDLPFDWEQIHTPDIKDLAKSIIELYELRVEKGKTARQIAVERFNMDMWAQKHMEIFESLC